MEPKQVAVANLFFPNRQLSYAFDATVNEGLDISYTSGTLTEAKPVCHIRMEDPHENS